MSPIALGVRGVGAGPATKGSPYLYIDGSNDNINFGSNAAIDDLLLADCTIECWAYSDLQNIRRLLSKYATTPEGWEILDNNGDMQFVAAFDTTPISLVSSIAFTVDEWFHIAVTFDSATKTATIWIDGQSGGADTGVGNYVSDNTRSLNTSYGGSLNRWKGGLGWVRISDNQRYTGAFTPPPRSAPPAIDGNTIEQWNVDEGVGSSLVGEVIPLTATITGATWMRG